MKTNYRKVSINQVRVEDGFSSIDLNCINKLVSKIKEFGLLEPIAVRKQGNGYKVILGTKRYIAAVLAGLSEVPVMIVPDNQHKSDMECYVDSKVNLSSNRHQYKMKAARILNIAISFFRNKMQRLQ